MKLTAALYNFNIESELPCSKLSKSKGLLDFVSLSNYLKNLPYGRTKTRSDYISVLTEEKGTCSTKHAFLKQVAIENNKEEIQLFIGIYKMNEANTKGVGSVLKVHDLEYIPEAHTYIKISGKILDITSSTHSNESFKNSLLTETEILPNEIGDFKIQFHQNYLKQWILENNINYTFNSIWHIRELCISALSQ